MKLFSKDNLQRTMIVYFLLIGMASLFVSVEFIADTQSVELKKALISGFERYSQHHITMDAVFKPIDKLRNKAILMVAIIMAVMIIVLTMFIKNITEPLQHMIEVSKKISSGDLSQTITIHSKNELAELGNVINETSSNLQEIILLSKDMCSNGNALIDEIHAFCNKNLPGQRINPKLCDKLEHLRNDLALLAEIIDFFNIYTVEKLHDR
jgi:methyl-accepting chemotaxis protein